VISELNYVNGCMDNLTCWVCGIDFRGSEQGLKYTEGVSLLCEPFVWALFLFSHLLFLNPKGPVCMIGLLL
jgi:hypothetical protein